MEQQEFFGIVNQSGDRLCTGGSLCPIRSEEDAQAVYALRFESFDDAYDHIAQMRVTDRDACGKLFVIEVDY